MKATLPSVSEILASPESTSSAAINGSAQPKSKKGKRKAQTYEGEGLFSVSRPVIYSTDADGKVLLTALEGTFSIFAFLRYNPT